jgi:TonB family protein
MALPLAREMPARTTLVLRIGIALVVLLLSFPSFVSSQSAAPVDPSDPGTAAIKQLAASASKAIHKAHLENVMVMDFLGPSPKQFSLLGRKLADQLQAELATDNKITLIDRKTLIEYQSQQALFIPDAAQPDPAEWIARQLSAKGFIIGTFEETGNGLALKANVYASSKVKDVGSFTATLPETDDLRALGKASLNAVGDDRQAQLRKQSSLPRSGTHGYGVPHCVYCPPAEFSEEARHKKVQATVTLAVTISLEGSATDFQVVHGYFYGLNQKAIETVGTWRFNPATDAQGNPAETLQTVEMSFHLY